MNRYLKRKQAEISLMFARYALKKHQRAVPKMISVVILWGVKFRSGKDPLAFMAHEESSDEKF